MEELLLVPFVSDDSLIWVRGGLGHDLLDDIVHAETGDEWAVSDLLITHEAMLSL